MTNQSEERAAKRLMDVVARSWDKSLPATDELIAAITEGVRLAMREHLAHAPNALVAPPIDDHTAAQPATAPTLPPPTTASGASVARAKPAPWHQPAPIPPPPGYKAKTPATKDGG